MPAYVAIPKNAPDSRWEVDISRPFGEGGFGAVYRGKDKCGESGKEDPKDCAAKRVLLAEKQDRESYETELDMLKAVGKHKHIIGFYGSAEDKDKENEGWLFLEMATGGELFDRLIDSGSLSERAPAPDTQLPSSRLLPLHSHSHLAPPPTDVGAAWPFVSSIADAVAHCHSQGVMHRDLKLENVMLLADDPHGIKLIDFGLAMKLDVGADGKVIEKKVKDTAGTQAYRAPEVNVPSSDGHSPLKVDVWAMGIVAFSLVAGFFPLLEAKESDWRYKKLKADQAKGMGACESIFKTYKRQCHFSPSLRELLDGMLTIEYETRLSVQEVLAHPWIQTAPASTQPDDDGDGPVYRGTDADELMEDFAIPEDAVPLCRQRAGRPAPMDDGALA